MQYPIIAQPQYAFAPTMMAEGGLIPAAKAVQSKGRNGDSMLVHMTPGEVGGLQALAMQHGGSLSINPQTGLPEANFLKNLLPTLLGVGLSFIPGVGPLAAGLAVGGLETVRTGDLGKGLMAGLGAYGGAGLAGGLQAAGGAASGATSGAVGSAEAAAAQAAGNQTAVETARLTAANQAAGVGATPPTFMENVTQAGRGLENIFTGQEGAFNRFVGNPAVAADEKTGQQAVQATGLGGTMGALKTAGALVTPTALAVPEYAPPAAPEEESDYEGPYTPTQRTVRYPTEEERRRRTAEFMYFTPSNPVPFAEGGETSGDATISPSEARVFSQIANVQRLAGLPAIDVSGLNVRPATTLPSYVYNPVGGERNYGVTALGRSEPMVVEPGATGEQSYGFTSLGNAATPSPAQAAATANAMRFFMPAGEREGYGNINNRLDQRFFPDRSDPDAYMAKFNEFTPQGQINMANYSYDPILGGYVKKPIRLTNPSPEDQGYGYYTYNYSKGGSVPQLENGGFVLTKKAVDGLGKGDNKRGQRVASRGLGAIPIKGPGTGTSDSIPTSIDGKRPARVSNGEAYVPKKQVAKHGGAKKFYALMKKAERRA